MAMDQQTALERQQALYREKNAHLRQYLEPVEPYEFYREIFPEGSFERKGHFEDAKGNGIALVVPQKSKVVQENGVALEIKGDGKANRHVITDELRELEDICDHVGLLHRGGILFSRDLDDMKLGMYKMQCIFPNPLPDSAWESFDILHKEQRGSLYTITARGSREELLARVNALNPTFCEMLPLTLEEIFINETEVAGYDVKKLLF